MSRTTPPRIVSAVLVLLLVAPPRGTEAGEPSHLRMKLVKVTDRQGFERPMTAATLLVPVDWTFDGEVRIDPGNACTATLATIAFRAASPDGRTSVELFPMAAWNWADDPSTRQLMQLDLQQKAGFGFRGCPLGPPLGAREYLERHVVPSARPGARVVAREVDPEAARAVSALVRDVEGQLRKAGLPGSLRADSARIRIEYESQGRPQEEWLTGVAFARAMPAPTLDPMTARLRQTTSYTCGAEYLFGTAAPRGMLGEREKVFRAILGSVRVDPEWQARVQEAQAGIQASETRGAAERSRIATRSAEEIREIQRRSAEARGASQDRTSQAWSQAMRGVETYRDPRSGSTVELSNRYGNAWSNGRGEYLLSDSPGFDPNTVSREGWTKLVPVKP